MRYNRIKQLGKYKFQEYANQVFSIAQMLEKLGYSKKSGGSYDVVKKYLQEYNIDTSHWTGQGWSKDQQLKDWSKYNSYKSSKKHLIVERTHKCELCELTNWREFLIPLEVHHIDGNKINNEYSNLQLLCPNCHALTDTWKGKGKKHQSGGMVYTESSKDSAS